MIRLNRTPNAYSAFTDRAIQARQQEAGRLQAQIGTGKRVLQPSDDPAAFSGARQMERLTNRLSQYQDTIAAARPWIDHTQQTLDTMAERFATAMEKGVQGANGTMDAQSREALATRIEGLKADVLDQLNAQFNGEYLFAGTATDAAPFSEDPATGVVSYDGNDGARTRKIGDTLSVDINVPGDALFDDGTTTATASLQALADALRDGDPDTIRTALGDVEGMHTHIIGKAAEAGSVANRLSAADDVARETQLFAENYRSNLEDTDMAEALAGMQEAQINLQAALKVTAGMLQTTLLDYLR